MNIQEYIKEYSERGFNLIPLAPNSKEPLEGFNLKKYFNEKYPVESLLALASKQDINLGVITGKTSNIAVIDVDVKDEVNKYLSEYPTDLVDRTPVKGGSHLYYVYRDGLPEILKIQAGDFFAGSHYVVLPPSKINGKAYEWLKQGQAGVLPQTLFSKQENYQTGKYTRVQVTELINQAMTNGLIDGQWNDTIMYGSIILAGDGWSKEAIHALMKSWNRGSKPIPDKQLQGMITRAIEYSGNNKYEKPELEVVKPTEFQVTSYGDLASKYSSYKASWMIDGWMLDSAIMVCAAPPERYKTWLSIDMALSVASGMPFLDTYEVNKTGNVLIIQQEDFGPRFFARFKTIERAKLDRASIKLEADGSIYVSSYNMSNHIFFHEEGELTLDNDEIIDRLEQRIIETGAVLCIIDPFYSLSNTTNDYYQNIAIKIREKIKSIRNRTGCAFLFIHHTNKAGNGAGFDSLDRRAIFGSQFVSAAMEGAIVMGRTKGLANTQVMAARFFKDENAQLQTKLSFHIHMDSEDDNTAYIVDVEDVSEDLMIDLIQFLEENGAQSFTEIATVFEDRFTSRGTFTRWLKGLVGKGIAHDGTRKGKYSVEPD